MNIFKITLALTTLFLSCSSRNEDWITYKSPQQQFVVTFPQQPKESEQKFMDPEIGELTMKMTSVELNDNSNYDNVFYNVMLLEYPKSYISSNETEKLDDFFKNSVQGAVNNVHGRLMYEKIISINEFPGREVKVSINNDSHVLTSRIYLVNSKLYMTQVITKSTNDFNKSINRFLESFSLITN